MPTTVHESESMNPLDQWETAFDDWVKLLRHANAMELLEDPKAIWDEAWRQAIMVAQEAQNVKH